MYTLDASVVTRTIDPESPQHRTCQLLLERLDQRAIPVIVPRLLLTEIAGAVRRVLRDPICARLSADAWRSLPHVQIVTLDDALIDAAADLAADYALRGADAVYVAVARQQHCTLSSLDREQRERANALIPVLTPDEALAALG